MNITLSSTEVNGKIQIPSSKSQTIRALLIACFSKKKSILRNPLFSSDTQACIDVCCQLGAIIKRKDDDLIIDATNLGVHKNEPLILDCDNSGTTMYLATAMCSTLDFPITFTGDKQLKSRPVAPLLKSLSDLGVKVEDNNNGFPPFTVQGPLKGGKTSIECRTSQYLSALLLASPLAENKSEINVPLLYEKPYVSITLSWLDSQNIFYDISSDYSHVIVPGKQKYSSLDSAVSGDFSSASFFFCAAAMSGGKITVEGLDRKDPQGDRNILDILKAMGCKVNWKKNSVTVQGPQGPLNPGDFDLNGMPDALPILAITGCFASGPVKLLNVPQARIKETDRIAVMAQAINKMGGNVIELEDGLILNPINSFTGGKINGHDDHRVIMALAIASLRCVSELTIEGTDAVSVTNPKFFFQFDEIRK